MSNHVKKVKAYFRALRNIRGSMGYATVVAVSRRGFAASESFVCQKCFIDNRHQMVCDWETYLVDVHWEGPPIECDCGHAVNAEYGNPVARLHYAGMDVTDTDVFTGDLADRGRADMWLLMAGILPDEDMFSVEHYPDP